MTSTFFRPLLLPKHCVTKSLQSLVRLPWIAQLRFRDVGKLNPIHRHEYQMHHLSRPVPSRNIQCAIQVDRYPKELAMKVRPALPISKARSRGNPSCGILLQNLPQEVSHRFFDPKVFRSLQMTEHQSKHRHRLHTHAHVRSKFALARSFE